MPQIPDYLKQIGKQKVELSKSLFNDIFSDFAGENIIMGITAAGKTKLISDALDKVIEHGKNGSLIEAYKEIERVNITPEMAPFLTKERKHQFKNKLVEALSKL